MKVSKVDHTRVAVGKKVAGIGGLTYEDPGKGTLDIAQKLKSRNRNIQFLYNVFNPIQLGTEPKRPSKDLDYDVYLKKEQNYKIKKANYDLREKYSKKIGRINSGIKKLIMRANDNKIKAIADIIADMKNADIDYVNAEELVSLALRKSLATKSKEAVTFLNCLGKNNISQQEQKEISEFIDLIRADYTKLSGGGDDSYFAKLVRSIDNQNVVVQVKEDGSIGVPVSDKSRSKIKKNEKSGVAQFLSDFAVVDKDARTGMLCKLRRLLDLFFGAPATFANGDDVTIPDCVCKEEFDVWAKHEAGKRTSDSFVSIPKELIQAKENDKALDLLVKNEKKQEINQGIRNRNMVCYRFAMAAVKKNPELFFADENINAFWIHHIEDAVERILDKRIENSLHKLNVGYLREKIWKDMLNYMSIKYIATGKIVYNFAMKDVLEKDKSIVLGTPSKIKAITSFDLENIKAKETLQREMAVSISFAANNLFRATMKTDTDQSDFFGKKKDFLSAQTLPGDTVKNIMQFFGGYSEWKDCEALMDKDSIDFLMEIIAIIYTLRNDSFHFSTAIKDSGSWDTKLIGELFEKEAQKCVVVEKNKYYSNNLPKFYTNAELETAMTKLYSKHVGRASQVPSFNKIVVRNSLQEFLSSKLKMNVSFSDLNDLNEWRSALYFMLKEIYYNDFLASDEAKKYFLNAVASIVQKEKKDDNEQRAINDFNKRIQTIKEYSLSEICQNIMTEYNLQNNQKRTVRSAKDPIFDTAIFKHYPLLLKEALGIAFAQYINKAEEYAFIKNPKVRDKGDEQAFLAGWNVPKYDVLISEVKNNAELQAWYITGKFMSARVLNQLIGTMRSYIQYVQDVKRRSNQTGNSVSEKSDLKQIEKIIEVLEVCVLLSGNISHEFSDYFEDAEDYAKYLSNYLEFNNDTAVGSYRDRLISFCNDRPKPFVTYVDAMNPILHKNVVLAKLFGPSHILAKVVKNITEDELNDYQASEENILKYKKDGKCKSGEEQEAVVKFQRLKNRIELRDLVDYGELINELLGQLINWSFMRERDLLYFQLGFHYYCLNNKFDKPCGYASIKRINGTSIDGAILSQIAGMYINGIGVYNADGEIYGNTDTPGGAGNRIGAFIKIMGEGVYTAGLEVFENINEHGDIINLRNEIDHFTYYSNKGRSIVEMYSEVFDRFFTYDMKYQKNVVNLLYNILLQHNVIADFKFGTGEKTIKKNIKPCACIQIGTLTPDRFTYKYDGGVLEIDAKSEEYLRAVHDILYLNSKNPDNVSLVSKKSKSVSGNKSSFGNSSNGSNKNMNNKYNNKGAGKNYYDNKKDKGQTYHSDGSLGNTIKIDMSLFS